MRRRGRRGKRGSKKGGIPLLVVLPAIAPGVASIYACRDNPTNIPKDMIWRYTGFQSGAGWNWGQALESGGPIIAGFVGHKILNKVGVNKYVKKLTMGYFTL